MVEPLTKIGLFEAIPARIRRKTATEFLRQRVQGRDHVVHPAGPRVIQRAAAERRVTSAKDHSAIDHVGIVDNALAQAGDADIRDRQDQPVDHFVRRLRCVWQTGALVGLAALPDVKTLAGLAAELAFCDFLAQPRRRRRQQVAELRAQHVADGKADVEADLPGELLTGSGSRSMAPTKASACLSIVGSVPSWLMTSTSCSRETGLKKCNPSRRRGDCNVERRSSNGMLEVLVARIAPGFSFGSREA